MHATHSRRPVAQRAGTRINHAVAEPVFVKRGRRTIRVGTLDPHARVYQLGGSLGTLLAHKLGAIGLGVEEWDAVKDRADTIELIDHGRNVALVIPVATAVRVGEPYDIGAGERFGIPLTAFRTVHVPESVSVDTAPLERRPTLFDSLTGDAA